MELIQIIRTLQLDNLDEVFNDEAHLKLVEQAEKFSATKAPNDLLAKFCCFSLSHDPSKLLSILTETGEFIKVNISTEDVIKSSFMLQQKAMKGFLH